MYDLTITYNDMRITETIAKVNDYSFRENLLWIFINATTTVVIPTARIGKLTVEG